MLFIEGKWFYNHVLSLKKNCGIKLRDINSTKIKEVERFNKDKNKVVTKLAYISS